MSELALREFHPFRAAGREFVYLVPSAAVFELDDAASAVIARLRAGEEIGEELTDAVDELLKVKAHARLMPSSEGPRNGALRAAHRGDAGGTRRGVPMLE